ncbi:NAD(P)-binding protein [Peniophora sp. CONT]|nr:NAD(P)-binding protein [Peniophora sp. CONT]
MPSPSIFILGASGFVGGHLTKILGEQHPDYRLLCLMRNPTPERIAPLKALHPNVEIVEGSLEDKEIISKASEDVDVVLNTASSDHWPSVEATLDGLTRNSAKHPGKPPLYIHVSGCGIISDNVRGEKVDNVKEWSDIGLDLKDCPPTNTHLESDSKIVEAGARSENPIRTIIFFPGQIYGIGEVQKTTLWLRIFSQMAKNVGYSGTWGPGEISQGNIHVRDCASALVFLLEAALTGKAGEGRDGLYFGVAPEPLITYKQWTDVMGDMLHKKGILKEPGSRPFPAAVTDAWGHYGWSLLGSNQHCRADRLIQMGWVPEWSKKERILDVLPAMIELAAQDLADETK